MAHVKGFHEVYNQQPLVEMSGEIPIQRVCHDCGNTHERFVSAYHYDPFDRPLCDECTAAARGVSTVGAEVQMVVNTSDTSEGELHSDYGNFMQDAEAALAAMAANLDERDSDEVSTTINGDSDLASSSSCDTYVPATEAVYNPGACIAASCGNHQNGGSSSSTTPWQATQDDDVPAPDPEDKKRRKDKDKPANDDKI